MTTSAAIEAMKIANNGINVTVGLIKGVKGVQNAIIMKAFVSAPPILKKMNRNRVSPIPTAMLSTDMKMSCGTSSHSTTVNDKPMGV